MTMLFLAIWIFGDSLVLAAMKYMTYQLLAGSPCQIQLLEDFMTTDTAKETETMAINNTPQENTETALVQQPIKQNYIEIWYHEDDIESVLTLDQYLQLTYRRLGPQIGHNYFNYRKTPKAPTYAGTTEYLIKDCEEKKAKYDKAEQN